MLTGSSDSSRSDLEASRPIEDGLAEAILALGDIAEHSDEDLVRSNTFMLAYTSADSDLRDSPTIIAAAAAAAPIAARRKKPKCTLV